MHRDLWHNGVMVQEKHFFLHHDGIKHVHDIYHSVYK